MKEQSAQATTARDLSLLLVAGSVLLIGIILALAGHVLAQTSPSDDGSATETVVDDGTDDRSTSTDGVDEPAEDVTPEAEEETESEDPTDDSSSGTGSDGTEGVEDPAEQEADDVADRTDDGSSTDDSSSGTGSAGTEGVEDPAEQEADAVSDRTGSGSSSDESKELEEEDDDARETEATQVAPPQNVTVRASELEADSEEALDPDDDDDSIPTLSEDETRILFRTVGEDEEEDGSDEEFFVGIHMFGEDEDEEEPRTLSPELMEDIAAFAEGVGRDPSGAFLSGTVGATDVRGYGEGLCEQNFIRPSACVSWLIGEFADSSCRDAGLLTKDACERFLTERNGGVFPGCETLDTLECGEHKALVTIDLMPDELFEDVDRIIEQAGKEQALVALPHMTSLRPEHVGRARWWGSPRTPGQQTSLGMIVIDTDLDGLPDDYEVAIGTDPLLADSDEDGVDDITELQRDLDPLGPGRLDRELGDTERTIVFRQPLEQPAAMPDADPSLSLGVNGSSDGLQGVCEPDQTCFLYFYSYVPMVLTATADAAGNWQYDLSDTMTDGHHTVYLAVTDDTGKIVKRSNPLSFFVNEAKAVTFDEFVAASVEPAAALTRGTPEEAISKYLYGVIALVLAAVVLAIGVLRKRPAV